VRIALVLRRFSEDGGSERFGSGLARWLLEQGHEVELCCASAEQAPAGATLLRLEAGGRGRIWRMLSLWRAARVVDRQRYDAVIALGRTPGHDVYRAGGGCHRAWIARNGWSLADLVELRLDRRAVLSAGRVIANSHLAAGELQRWYGLPAARLRVIHNGVDLQRFRPEARQALPVGGPAAIFLGNGWARKGLDTALEAVSRVPGLCLVVAGAERHPERWRRRARALGLEDRVRFLGPLRRPEELLPAAAALILPTRYDPFANAVLEAMACGVPAISSGADGAAELLPEPWMKVEDPRDAAGFARALERALHEPRLRVRCRETAEAHPAQRAFQAVLSVARECRP